MKKFKTVLDGIRQSYGTPAKSEMEIEETLRTEHFQVCKTVRHGFPFQPTAVAFDPVQHILAIGTKSGSLRIFGRPGVDCHCRHDGDVAIIQILFLINEGALVTVCSDDTLHLWNFRQKRPEIVNTLKFQRERITHCQLPFQSKWLYIGTERGNVHVVNIESFNLSGYVINWNKAIELCRRTHPGPVVHLSDNPMEPNKLLIGFESGTVVMWDLRHKTAEYRYNSPEALRSICWHHEGKQFMCSHSDGSLTTWNIKQFQKPVSLMMPHAKIGKDGKPDPCKPITKVEWKSVRNGEPLVIFSGGMSYDKAGRTPSVTVMNGKSTTVLEMEHNVVDFVVLCDTPWQNDFQDPYAIVVLLQNDLVVVDLTSPGYPCFENPYPMDIHESPVTACQYYADCPPDLIPAFYSVGSKQKRSGFSEKGWPIKGGEWGTTTCSYPEIIITGHADGSIKFWDASAVTLQVLYKLKTAKTFEKPKSRIADGQDDDPFAIQMIHLCAESRILLVAGATHVILYRFSKQEVNAEVPCLEVTLLYEVYDDLDSPEFEYPKPSLGAVTQQSGSLGSCSQSSNTSDCPKLEITHKPVVIQKQENMTSVKVRPGARKWSPGYQPCLTSILTWVDGEPPGNVTSISLNSSYGLMAYGNESGLAIIDFLQKTCLLNLGTPDLYGSMDPYQRAPRSPKGKRPLNLECVSQTPAFNEEVKSPTTDQFTPSPFLNGSPSQQVSSPVSKFCFQEQGLSTISEKPKGSSSQATKGHEKLKKKRSRLSVTIPGDISSTKQAVSDSEALDSPDRDPLSQTWHFTKCDQPPHTSTPIVGPAFKIPAHKTISDPFGKNNVPHQIPQIPPKVSEDAYKNSSFRRSSSNPELSIPGEPCVIKPDGEEPRLKSKKSLKHRISKKFKNFRKDHEKQSPEVARVSPQPDQSEETNTSSAMADSERESITDSNSIKFEFEQHDDHVSVAEEAIEATECLVDAEDGDVEPRGSTSGEKGDTTDGPKGFLRRVSTKMSVKLKSLSSKSDLEEDELNRSKPRHKRSKDHQFKVEVVDLSDDSVKEVPTVRLVNLNQFTSGKFTDKTDGSSFSRSRSSSMSSLENVTKEAIQCLVFADSYTRKTDNFTAPCLWVGTSLGSVLVIVLNLPPPGEQRLTQPVIVSPSGTIFRLKGSILTMSFLDCNGVLIQSLTDHWKDIHREPSKDEKKDKDKSSRQQSVCSKPKISPSASTDVLDRQFAIIVSEKQARVMSLPSQTCAYKVKVTDTSFVVKAEVVGIRDSVCLCCYVGNGRLMAFSLPSLKLLLDRNYLPLTDLRVARTFSFSSNGHALYLCSPTEVQKMTISSDISVSLSEMLGDLFLPCETPEAPKMGFFKNFFGAAGSTLDREELFGEASGKASKGLAKLIPGSGGMQHLQAQSGSVMGEVARTRQALTERGEKLGELDEKTAQMMAQAESFHNAAHQIMQKYKDKKWYQF